MAKYFKETLPKPTVRLAPRGVDKDRKTKLLQTLPAIAVHIELVSKLTTEAFLATFKGFISRRGKPLTS
nr:unnamed protein product [Callosobruchus chinensis]